jgi:hypothetical protein
LSSPIAVPLTVAPTDASPPIACTLGADDMAGRYEAWRKALEPVVARAAIDRGMRLTFAPEASLATIADLLAAEQACCMFFRFAITVDTRGAALEVTAPSEAQDLLRALFGVPS